MTPVHESTHATKGDAVTAILPSLEAWARDFGEVAIDLVDEADGVRVVVLGRASSGERADRKAAA